VSAPLVIRLPGEPRGKGRHRTRVMQLPGGRAAVRQHPDAKTDAYEKRLCAAAQVAMAGRPLMTGMLSVVVFAFFPIPARWPKRKKEQARARLLRPTVKPDWDNIGKTTDALNAVVWGDDASVVDGFVRKFYADLPELVVTVEEISVRDAVAEALPRTRRPA
jgi:Holliday junction resolvase RusA-like endonuclease